MRKDLTLKENKDLAYKCTFFPSYKISLLLCHRKFLIKRKDLKNNDYLNLSLHQLKIFKNGKKRTGFSGKKVTIICLPSLSVYF